MTGASTFAAAEGVSYLIALQIASRALTFGINQVLLRFLTPQTLGRAVQLELYSISVLFFSRESLRVAAQRVGSGATTGNGSNDTGNKGSRLRDKKSKGHAVQVVVNFSYLSLAIGAPLALILGGLTWKTLSGTTAPGESTPYLGHAIPVYGLASVIEIASEPGFGAAQALLLFKVRAGAEATATMLKTLATLASAILAYRLGMDVGVMPLAIGQLAFSVGMLGYYLYRLAVHARTSGFSLWPVSLDDNVTATKSSDEKKKPSSNDEDRDRFYFGLFSVPLFRIATSLTFQSTTKYILTQGDSFLIAALTSLQDQGSYALASNYGGLIARMLFQPIEETSRSLFAKLCSPLSSSDANEKQQASSVGPSPPRSPSEPQKAASVLQIILKIYLLISLPIVALGPSLASPLLGLVAGSRWTALGAGDVLGAYAYYIPLLALNGILEAFVSAVGSGKVLYYQTLWMGLCFVLFAVTAWVAVTRWSMGAKGVVLANGVNMIGRITFAVGYAGWWFGESRAEWSWLDVLPNASSIAATATVPFLVNATEGLLAAYGILGQIVRLGAIGAVLVGAIGVSEISFFKQVYATVRSR